MIRAVQSFCFVSLCLLAAACGGAQQAPLEPDLTPSRFALARQHEMALDRVAARFDSSSRTMLSPSRVDWVGRLLRVRRGVTVAKPESIFDVGRDSARHVESGLDCPASLSMPAADLAVGQDLELRLKDAIIFDAQGRDVACHYVGVEFLPVLTLFATYAPRLGVGEAVDTTRAAILRRFTRASRRTVIVAADGNRFETAASAVDIGAVNERAVRSSVWVSDVQGWKLKLRLTYYTNTTHVSELGAAVILLEKAEAMDAFLNGVRG